MFDKVILASSSTARKKLLEDKNIKVVQTISTDIDEKIEFSNIELSIENIAVKKLLNARSKLNSDYPILAFDTVVCYNDIIFGKSKDKKEARKVLKLLRGNTHKIITGFSVYLPSKNITISGYETTLVSFGNLDDKTIESYLDFNDYQNCAGGYRIQNLPKEFNYKVFDDIDNVVGLPFSKICCIINKLSDRQ